MGLYYYLTRLLLSCCIHLNQEDISGQGVSKARIKTWGPEQIVDINRMSIWWIVQTGYRQKFSWFTSHPIRCLTTTTPLLLSSWSLLRIYRQSYHGLLTLFAQMTIAAAILQTTLLSYCGKRLDVAYIFWISWRKKRKPWKIVLCISLHVHACSTSLSAEIPFLGERTCFCFESTYVNYSSESFGRTLAGFSQKIFCMYRQFF